MQSSTQNHTIRSLVDLSETDTPNIEGDETRIGKSTFGDEIIVAFSPSYENAIHCGEAYGDKMTLTPAEALRLASLLTEAANELNQQTNNEKG